MPPTDQQVRKRRGLDTRSVEDSYSGAGRRGDPTKADRHDLGVRIGSNCPNVMRATPREWWPVPKALFGDRRQPQWPGIL